MSTTERFASISVVGLGYVGLPTAAVFASRGVEVLGVDVNPRIVDTINRGRVHIVEKDLEGLVQRVVAKGTLRAATRPNQSQAFIIAVPTPFKDNHVPDVDFVEAAARTIAPALVKGNLIVLESTSPVGTTEAMSRWLAQERTDLTFPHQQGETADVQIAYCPERVLPGNTLEELVKNDRVIGGMTPYCARRAAALYRIFVEGECLLTNARTAELAKLAENSFRDVNIAFANELSLVSQKLGVDVWELIALTNRHPRVKILQPGPGVGGHCIAVDPWFIVHSAPEEARIINLARRVNDEMPRRVVARIKEQAARFRDPVIGCLGLSYKADIDDLRESPAVEIVKELAHDKVGTILAVEPHVTALPAPLTQLGVELSSLPAVLHKANIVVLLVNHRTFAHIDFERLQGKVVIDTRGMWRLSEMREQLKRTVA
jgi:UDP-N-acetyl-D-mannosaminuronic acid dehydrogenase